MQNSEYTIEQLAWERNMLALKYAMRVNAMSDFIDAAILDKDTDTACGWYFDDDGTRVISLDHGKICFRIPDDFNVGRLPQIEAPEKIKCMSDKQWEYIADCCGIKGQKKC